MSNFWADKLRQGPPPRQGAPVAPPQPAYQPPAQRAWWDTTPQPAPEPSQPSEPTYPTASVPAKAKHTRQSERCPECAGGNYFSPPPPADQRHGPRCYDCGYPKLHSTSGVMASSDGEVRAARQPHGAESHYHPEIIVDRVR